jgi:large subunit ribosomal protein L34e
VSVRLPGGGRRVHYRPGVCALPRCSVCGRPLTGLPRVSEFGMTRLSGVERRVSRPFGGQICSDCVKRGLVRTVRGG